MAIVSSQRAGYRFRTSPPPDRGSIRVAALGDSGSGTTQQSAVAEVIRGVAPDLLLHTGDLIYLREADEVVFGMYGDLLAGACLYPAAGNHDEDLDWRAFFFPPDPLRTETASTIPSIGGARTSSRSTRTTTSRTRRSSTGWNGTSKRRGPPGFPGSSCFFHKPLYTVGGKIHEAEILRPALTPYLDRFEVDLVLNGHDHNYQRSHPVRGGSSTMPGRAPISSDRGARSMW
jgi:hypothetical protein